MTAHLHLDHLYRELLVLRKRRAVLLMQQERLTQDLGILSGRESPVLTARRDAITSRLEDVNFKVKNLAIKNAKLQKQIAEAHDEFSLRRKMAIIGEPMEPEWRRKRPRVGDKEEREDGKVFQVGDKV